MWCIKCKVMWMPCHPSHFTYLGVTNDTYTLKWHMSKKHSHMFNHESHTNELGVKSTCQLFIGC
jgi:hypothetical protein